MEKSELKQDPSFWRSSGIIFGVNNLHNVVNYTVLIFANYFLAQEFGAWVSITALLSVALVPLNSFMAILSRKTSELTLIDDKASFKYYFSIFTFLRKFLFTIILALPVISALVIWLMKVSYIDGILITLLFSITTVFAINNNFLLGLIKVKEFSFTNLLTMLGRLVGVLIFLKLGFSLTSLPLGLGLGYLAGSISSFYFIHKLWKQVEHSSDQNSNQVFHFKDLAEVSQVMGMLVIMSLFLNADIILARVFFNDGLNQKYGIVSTFGQIAHFGSVSFTNIIIPFVARKSEKPILSYAIFLVIALSLSIILIFAVFGSYLVKIFKGSEEALTDIIIRYGFYILFYNLVFIFINYLVAKNSYNVLKRLSLAAIGYILGLVGIGSSWSLFTVFGSGIEGFVNWNTLAAIVLSLGLFWEIQKASKLESLSNH